MSVSSARPDDLDAFAAKSRAADEDLRGHGARLRAIYGEFLAGTSWGRFDASSMLVGFGRYIDLNEIDARWVAQIAAAFRAAGGSGSIKRLPDAAIQASLRAAGLEGGRGSVTFDDPVAFGFPPTTGYADDPVNTASGNFLLQEVDLPFTGLAAGLRLLRTYNSRSDRTGAFGPGWASWASARLRARPDGAEYEGPDGQRAVFPRLGAGYGRVLGVNALVEPLPAGLAMRWFDGRRWEFDDAGLPVRAQRGPGTEVRFRHDGGRLVELSHAGGKILTVNWTADRVTALSCSDGRRVAYRYDASARLVEADGDAGRRRYDFDDDSRVRSVTDADGVVEVVNTYDPAGRVVEQLSRFGRRTSFAYLPGRVTVTGDDSGGPANTYVHDLHGRLLAVVDGHGQRFSMAYDEWGNPVAITERNGAVVVQEWDDRGRLVRRVLPTGAEFTFGYDDADRVVEVAASTGGVTRYRYDGAERVPSELVDAEGGVTALTVVDGLVRRVIDPDGVALAFEFDPDGNLVAAVDADGNTARLERDAAGRVTAAVTPAGRRTTFGYDPQGRLTERRDPAGAAWRYEHSASGRPTALTDPTGGRREIRYAEHGEPSAVVDALGRATTRRYDVFGNLAGVSAPDGAKWEFAYDALSRLTSIADPAGARWLREYDVNGNLTGSVDPVGTHYTATVDQAGRVTALSDGLTSSEFELDPLGRALVHRRPDGTRARAGYDRCGRRTTIEDPAGGTTRIDHTPAGRIRRVVSPSGRVEEYEYDRCGRLAARIDGAGRRWIHRYDADGALVERVFPSEEVERFVRDPAGRLVEWVAPGRGTTRYEYDLAGRSVAVNDRVAGTRRFRYDPAGQLIEAVDANGGTTRYSYNRRGWLTQIRDPLGGTHTRRHDEVGRVVAETDPLGRTTTYSYDAAGRLIERVDGSGRRVRWSYDRSGRVRSFGAPDRPAISIERDALGRPLVIDEPGSFRHELRWDRAGRLVERRRGELTLRWRYDEDGNRTAIGYPDNTETIYAYDPSGLVAGLRHPAVGAIQLERDPSGRLIGATGDGMRARWRYTGGELTGYDIDAGGQRRTTELTRDPSGRIESAAVDGALHRFSYDPAGQLVAAATPGGEFTFGYDANGRLVRERSPAGGVAYRYDGAGQLLAREHAGAVTTLEYDGAGRRVRETRGESSRIYDWDGLGRLAGVSRSGPGGAGATRTVVDALGELAEIDGVPLLWDTADPLAPLCWLDRSAVVGLGSPWALVGDGRADWLAPDGQGSIGDARDPWGAADGGAGPRLGYRGEVEFDALVWLRNRAYQPATRSFLTPDPLPPVPGTPWSANPYCYAGNNPVGLADPLGLRPVTDAELRRYRDQVGRNLWETTTDWVGDNWEYIAAGAMVVGGVALMFTGVGGPAGIALMAASGGLIAGGASAGIQRFTTGEVDWRQVGQDALIGAATGGAGAGAATALSTSARLAATNPFARELVLSGAESLVSGMAERGLTGGNMFNPRAMAADLLTAGATPAPGGRLGADRLPAASVEQPMIPRLDPSSEPSRVAGPWTIDDLRRGAFGRSPRSLGSPELHHGGQMPGSGVHEVHAPEHRGPGTQPINHPNKYNQGVTPEMRESDRQLHWWYRSQEMGGRDILGPDYYYD